MNMWTETFPTWEQKKQVLTQLADIYMEMFGKPVTYEDRLLLNSKFGHGYLRVRPLVDDLR